MTFSILGVDNLQSAVKIQDRKECIDFRAKCELCTLPIPFLFNSVEAKLLQMWTHKILFDIKHYSQVENKKYVLVFCTQWEPSKSIFFAVT